MKIEENLNKIMQKRLGMTIQEKYQKISEEMNRKMYSLKKKMANISLKEETKMTFTPYQSMI